MADGIYVSMCGAAARTAQLDAIADNLANAQTPGFKASRPAFEAFMAASGANDKSYPAAIATHVDVSPGPTSNTGEPLDVVPEGAAFLAVELPGGGRGYTRDGRLSVAADGRITQAGRAVLDRSGSAIRIPPGATPAIQPDGTITAGNVEVGALGLYTLEGPVDRAGGSTYVPGAGGRAAEVAQPRVRVGEVELGNATPMEGMVQLIGAQRQFDATMQALQTYRSMDGRGSELGRIR